MKNKPERIIQYILKDDVEDPKTIWFLAIPRGQCDPAQFDWVQRTRQCPTIHLGDVEMEFLSFYLRGFKNLFDHNGKEVVFKTIKKIVCGKTYDVVDEEILRVISSEIIRELCETIFEEHKKEKETKPCQNINYKSY